MRKIKTIMLLASLCLGPMPASADTSQYSADEQNSLKQYFENFGLYIGYDFSQPPSSSSSVPAPTNALLPFTASNEQPMLSGLVALFFGAIPVNEVQSDYALFVPTSSSLASTINTYANITFPSYSTANSSSAVSVNNLIDQQTYQTDPVSQYVLNILSTPTTTSNTACSTCVGSSCNPLCQMSVMSNVVGSVPQPTQYYTTSYNDPFLSELNANSLIAPLMYSTSTISTQTASSSGGTTTQSSSSSTNPGLVAASQTESAENFIRFASGSVVPPDLPSYSSYNSLYTTSLQTDSSDNPTSQALQAQVALTQYLAQLRIFAAQTSVVMSNLYAILARRIPQTLSGSSSGSQTSTALSEFQMATWRILPESSSSTSTSSSSQWIEQINQASPITVQKEMAILLAEINYQLYLSRQQQERILLTNSMLLLQTIQKPLGSNLATQPPASVTTTTSSSSS